MSDCQRFGQKESRLRQNRTQIQGDRRKAGAKQRSQANHASQAAQSRV